MNYSLLRSFLLLSVTLAPAAAAEQAATPQFDGVKAKQIVAHLAADELKGRMTCTDSFRQAADWSADQFRQWGLKPAGENGTYFQKVTIRDFTERFGKPELTVRDRDFQLDDSDYSLAQFSTPGTTVKSDVVFVGYGISSPKKGLDEYHGIDVKNKVVLILTGSPQTAPAPRQMFSRSSSSAAPQKAPPDPWKAESSDQAKLRAAYDHGAAAALLFNPDEDEQTSSRRYSRYRRSSGFEPKRKFLGFTINERIFRAIMKASPQESARGTMRRLDTIRRAIKAKKPQSVATGVALQLKGYDAIVSHNEKNKNNTARNVLAKIEGTDPKLKQQVILVGAHLDHVGMRNGYINNGADDNASGSAVVLETARVLAASKVKPRRTLIFALWCGEELGLIGSRYYTKQPCDGVSMDHIVTSFNLDMVGMGDTLGASGALNFPTIWEVIKRGQDPKLMKRVEPGTGGPGGSDHTGFIIAGIETIFFMSRGGKGHQDYHNPEDDTDKIEPEMLARAGQFVVRGMLNVANETKVNLVIPRRLDHYRGVRMRIANFNPALEGSTWTQIAIAGKTADAIHAELRTLMRKLLQIDSSGSRNRGDEQDPPTAPRKSITRGVTVIDRLAADERLLDLAIDLHGIGRVDIANNQPGWIAKGRLTDAGKEGLQRVETRSLAVHLMSPEKALIEDVLAATKKPFIITGDYEIPEDLVDRINARQVQLGVNLNPKNVSEFITHVEALKSALGQRQNLFAYVTIADGLDEAKPALYLGLLDKGWARNEITGTREQRGLMGGAALSTLGK